MAVTIESQRFEKMCNAFHRVADFATIDDPKYAEVIRWINDLKDSLQIDISETPANGETRGANEVVDTEQTKITSPLIVREDYTVTRKTHESDEYFRLACTNENINFWWKRLIMKINYLRV
ncbi:hypothetical protein OROGR_025392 [Orobanche gracilis]